MSRLREDQWALMRRLLAVVGLLFAGLVSFPGSAVADTGAGTVEVTMDRAAVTGVLGDYLTFESTIANAGGAPTGPLIAHLDVVSLRRSVYVDAEDWSDSRTIDVPSLAPRTRTTQTWTVHNVNAGEFDVYVVVVPAGEPPSSGSLAISPPIRLSVTTRQTLNPDSSLGVVIAVPVGLGLLTAGTRFRRRGRARG
jgi:hypothetical protein